MLPFKCTVQQAEELRHATQTLGFGYLPGAIAPAVLQALDDEACERLASLKFAEQSDTLAYRAKIGSLGPQELGFFSDDETLSVLHFVFGRQLVLSQNCSSLTFYGAGDHLGAHRDQPETDCSVTFIAYISVRGPTRPSLRTGLVLHVYGEQAPLDEPPRLTIPTTTGTVVVGYGARFWHERPILAEGEQVVALTGCFGTLDLPR